MTTPSPAIASQNPTPQTQNSRFLPIRTQCWAPRPPSQAPKPDVSSTSLYPRGHPDTSMNPSGTPVVEAKTRALPALSPGPAPPPHRHAPPAAQHDVGNPGLSAVDTTGADGYPLLTPPDRSVR